MTNDKDNRYVIYHQGPGVRIAGHPLFHGSPFHKRLEGRSFEDVYALFDGAEATLEAEAEKPRSD